LCVGALHVLQLSLVPWAAATYGVGSVSGGGGLGVPPRNPACRHRRDRGCLALPAGRVGAPKRPAGCRSGYVETGLRIVAGPALGAVDRGSDDCSGARDLRVGCAAPHPRTPIL